MRDKKYTEEEPEKDLQKDTVSGSLEDLYAKLGSVTYQLEVYKVIISQLNEDKDLLLKEIDKIINS